MAFTTQEEAILRAIMNSFLAAGFTSEAEATAALTGLKLQNDLTAAQAALNAEFAAFSAVEAQYAADRSAGQAAVEEAVAIVATFVTTNPTLGPEDVDQYVQLQRNVAAAQAGMDALEANFADATEAHTQAVSDLSAAVEAAQAALDAHASGA